MSIRFLPRSLIGRAHSLRLPKGFDMASTTVVPKPITFSVSREDDALITQIARRCVRRAWAKLERYEFRTVFMDVTACHANGCPLELKKLLDSPVGDFDHDLEGIRRHIDRSTGRLQDCFAPRCSLPEGDSRKA